MIGKSQLIRIMNNELNELYLEINQTKDVIKKKRLSDQIHRYNQTLNYYQLN